MIIEEKFSAIVAGSQLPVEKIASPNAVGHSPFRSREKGVYYYEENSFLQSPWKIAPKRRITNFIGRNSYVNSGGIVRTNVLIGRYCSIGQRVTLAAGIHNPYNVSTHPALAVLKDGYSNDEKKMLGIRDKNEYTIIGNDVWIGDGAVIMPGISIGNGSIIAANAVVTCDVPPYSIFGGVPAKLIRERFSKEICKKLLESGWWNFSEKTIKSLPIGNVFNFIDAIAAKDIPKHQFSTYVL